MAFSADLAWRVVWLVLLMGMTYREVAELLHPMSIGSVHNILWRFIETGDVATEQGFRLAQPANTLMTPHMQMRLLEILVDTDAEDTLSELRSAFCRETGVLVSIPCICVAVRRLGYTRKRVRYGRARVDGAPLRPTTNTPPHPPVPFQLALLAFERDARKCADFVTKINDEYIRPYGAQCLIWCDETHVDQRTRNRRYGYSLRGRPAVSKRGMRMGGQRYSSLGIFDISTGLVDHHTVEGGIKADEFFAALIEKILTRVTRAPLAPCPRRPRAPHASVCSPRATRGRADDRLPGPSFGARARQLRHPQTAAGASPHYCPGATPSLARARNLRLSLLASPARPQVYWAVSSVGGIVEFLPPYGCDIAMHEKCLRSAKDYVRSQKNEPGFASLPVVGQIDVAMQTVTPPHVVAAMKEIGYLTNLRGYLNSV